MTHVDLSRRRFIVTSAKVAAGVGVGVKGLSWLTGCASDTPTDPSGIWKELENALTGDLLRPGSSQYFTIAKPWALQYEGILPQAIAQCLSEQDVQTCVNWARKHKVEVVAKSGGHSYAGYSQTTGLMIDVSQMNGVVIDDATGYAIIDGGARNKHVYAALRPASMAVTHGRCKEVGVAGLVLGGGIGFNMRTHGLTCDQLVATRIVMADGSIKTCSATENTDLFWALRGAGGGNFGIHTQFTMRPFPVGMITVFNLSWMSNQRIAFEAIHLFLMQAPETLGAKLSVIATKVGGVTQLRVNLLGQYVGSSSDLMNLLGSVYAVAAPDGSDVQELPYWDGQEILSEEGDPEYSHERSRFAFQPLEEGAIDAIFRNLNAWPGTSVAATWKFFLMGGKVPVVLAHETAFVHRSASMITSIDIEWKPSDADLASNFTWLDAFHAEMEQYTSTQCYQNFIDRREVNYLDAYYGTNLDRLKQVKTSVDPTNMFTYPQAIPRA